MSEHTQPRTWTLRRYDPEGRNVRVEVDGPIIPASPTVLVELDPMLDLIERLMSPLFEVREDAGAEAITLLRAHGRLGAPVVSSDEATELESGWA